MDVSKKLAQLVTEPESGHESRHYGTVTAVSAIDATHSVVTVLLDGATEPTVCDSHDVKVTVNDRVEVEVRDHRATVKANSTHPVTDDGAATVAWNYADSAKAAADSASESSRKALSYLLEVEDDWEAIENYREDAEVTLVDIHTAATDAADAASVAQDAADAAQESADDAKDAADRSLVQLSIVEDVSGTLTWIAEHGTYVATTDTTVQEGTVYFQLVSGDYVPVAQPTGNPRQQGWYVLDVTDSQTEYIMAHLAVTSQGLWVLPSGIGSETTPDTGETQADSDARQGDGYKVLLSSTGMTVYDNYGDAVATYGETTTFASDRDWYVGSSNAFIFFDASQNAIQIGGANVTIGGLTPGQLAGSQIWTATADPTTPNYTFAISNLTGPSGVSPRVGDLVMRSYYRYTISSVSTTTVLTGNRTSIRGGTGPAGSSVTVSSVEYAYQLSTSGTTIPTGTWGSTPVAPTATQYAWTRTTTTYSDNTTAVTYTVGGKGGADGSPGTSVTISSKSVKYQASTSGTTTPTGTWLDSVPTVAQGSYLWTRTVVTYSTGDSTTAYSVARMGSDGQTGAAGPEAVVSISVTAANFSANTGTLSASLRVNGTVTTPTSYKWTKGTATTSLGTSQTLSITDLNATYNCTVTWSGGTQVGSIDLAATSAVKTYAAATFATQDTVSSMEAGIEQNARDITLRATKTEAYQLSQPNLTPYFLMPMTQTTDTYWDNISYTRFTQLEDGWAHFSYANSGSSTVNNYILPKVITTLTPGGRYTLLVEFRNVSISSDGGNFYSQQNVYAQVWGTDSYGGFSISNAAIRALANGQGVFRKSLTLLTADSKDPSGTVRGSLPKTQFMSINQQVTAGQSVSYDLRLSLYEGEYTGPYKPYVGGNLYASQAELKVANDEIDARVEKDGVISAINLSSESATIQASKVEIDGTAVFNAISSNVNSAITNKVNAIQVGGRNLLRENPASYAQSGYLVYKIPTEIALSELSVGDTLTFQFWDVQIDSNSSGIHIYWGGGSCSLHNSNLNPDAKGYCSLTYEVTSGHATHAHASNKFIHVYNFVNGHAGASCSISHWKMERGNKATDWSPAPEDMAAASESVEYIVGTQTAKTGSWTGVTRDSSLYAGKTISYKLPYAGDGNASLQLKDASGTNVGGNIAVYLNTARVTTHFGAGSIIQMTYDGTYWRATAIPNSNNYDRRLHNNAVKAAANIAQYKICCGTSAGYKAIAASVTFDLSYPLLYLSSANQSGQNYAVASGGTSTAFYEALPSVTFTNTATIESGGAYKMLYLKGTVSGNTFTVAASNFLTTVVPSAVTDPTAFYIPLGMMTSATAGYFATSKDLYAYADDKFRQVNPTDIVSSQRIYYCTDLANSELVGPTSAWVTQDGNVYNAWTTKVPPIAASTAEGEDKYPFLYTCEQRKRLDGTIACTDVGLDESVGVIDGGSIIMHSIVAEKIDAHSINSSHVLSVGAFTDEDYELISNAGVKEDLSKLSAAFADYTDVTGQWIHVDRTTGVILGKTGSSDYQQLTNDRQMFVSSGVVVAYTYKGRFYGKAMEAEEMHIGGFMWVARSNGHFSLKYVGGGS